MTISAKRDTVAWATCFNARGDKAPPHRSCARSKAANFCDVPTDIVISVSRLFNVEKQLMDTASAWPHATNCDLLSEVLPAKCMRGWRITKFLGRGAFGYVFGSREVKGKRKGALKIQVQGRTSAIKKEINAHKQFSKFSLSPTIHDHCVTAKRRRSVFFVNMGRIDTTLERWLESRRSKATINQFVDKFFGILQVMRKKGITHGDMHSGNIGFIFKRQQKPGRIQLLDHGFSSTKGALTDLEIVQFIRSMRRAFTPTGHRQTIDYLVERCREEAKKRYGLRLSRSSASLDESFRLLRGRLRRLQLR